MIICNYCNYNALCLEEKEKENCIHFDPIEIEHEKYKLNPKSIVFMSTRTSMNLITDILSLIIDIKRKSDKDITHLNYTINSDFSPFSFDINERDNMLNCQFRYDRLLNRRKIFEIDRDNTDFEMFLDFINYEQRRFPIYNEMKHFEALYICPNTYSITYDGPDAPYKIVQIKGVYQK